MVRVRLFAWFREKAKRDTIVLSPGRYITVGEVLEQIKNEIPELRDALKENNYFVAVNHEAAEKNTEVKDSDEIAIFPPVSGG
ncbi:molybdopterin synthase small subunit [archaeon]|nr:molybdopterin synthase small subunit [archaeon]